ncbi:MAG: DUF6385 domain-containing protein [Bacteroidota bacterium]
MRHFYASAVERRITKSGIIQSYPMEAGWASEAIFFVNVENIVGKGARLTASVQISPDGINWIDEGTIFPVIEKEGHYYVKVNHFGNWLRINAQMEGGATNTITLSVHLHLKS